MHYYQEFILLKFQKYRLFKGFFEKNKTELNKLVEIYNFIIIFALFIINFKMLLFILLRQKTAANVNLSKKNLKKPLVKNI